MKSKVTWILILDGAQARVLENRGPGTGLKPVKGMSFSEKPLMAQEIVSDRPGRAFASAGTQRSAMEPRTDPVQHREAEFVRSVADALQRRHQKGQFERLVIAAAPSALGDLRPLLGDNVKRTVIAELHKDLINTPKAELDSHFEGILAV